jgi:hypothetical protein
MKEGNKCRILRREAKEREYGVDKYAEGEVPMVKNVTAQAVHSVAKWQVCKTGFPPVQILFARPYVLPLQVAVWHFVHLEGTTALETGD